jgi:hypothetical protein
VVWEGGERELAPYPIARSGSSIEKKQPSTRFLSIVYQLPGAGSVLQLRTIETASTSKQNRTRPLTGFPLVIFRASACFECQGRPVDQSFLSLHSFPRSVFGRDCVRESGKRRFNLP